MMDESIYCLQTVSKTKSYLLPSSAVLDILPFTPFDSSQAKGFILGHFLWKEARIPVIDLCLESSYEVTPLTHIMVVQYPVDEQLALFGALISQIPNAIPIGPEDLVFEGEAVNHLYSVRGQALESNLVDLVVLGKMLEQHQTA